MTKIAEAIISSNPRPLNRLDFLIAMVPAALAAVAIGIFGNHFTDEMGPLFAGGGEFFPFWITILVFAQQVRHDASRIVSPVADSRYYRSLLLSICAFFLVAQDSILESFIVRLDRIDFFGAHFLFTFAFIFAQVTLLSDALKVGVSWRR